VVASSRGHLGDADRIRRMGLPAHTPEDMLRSQADGFVERQGECRFWDA